MPLHAHCLGRVVADWTAHPNKDVGVADLAVALGTALAAWLAYIVAAALDWGFPTGGGE